MGQGALFGPMLLAATPAANQLVKLARASGLVCDAGLAPIWGTVCRVLSSGNHAAMHLLVHLGDLK